MYNSGVIVFKRGLPVFETWADLALEHNHTFAGDQDILSKVIYDQKLAITVLSPLYNWERCRDHNAEAVILHWHGQYGKSYIYHQIMSASLKVFFPNL